MCPSGYANESDSFGGNVSPCVEDAAAGCEGGSVVIAEELAPSGGIRESCSSADVLGLLETSVCALGD